MKKFINLNKSYWIIKKYYVDPNKMVKFLIKLLTFNWSFIENQNLI